jgi:hypothetical protein
MKKDSPIHGFIALRAAVGFLGQVEKWWACQFLGSTGPRMLQTIFPRTANQAALRSAMQAAALHHDKALGKRGICHLFRLPVAVEERISVAMDQLDTNAWSELVVTSKETAFGILKQLAPSTISIQPGPVQVGTIGRIATWQSAEELALHYHAAFSSSIVCIPYFGAKTNAR